MDPLNPQAGSLSLPQTVYGDTGQAPIAAPQPNPFDPARLVEIFKRLKKEACDNRWIWERDWLRDLYYVTGKQWIMWHPSRREWVDKRLQKWIPRPVTNKMAETVQAIRSVFASINLAVVARPVGHDTQSIATAEITSQMAPLIHEEHNMNQVIREGDFWLITTGNVVLQVSWDKDERFNRIFVPFERCVACMQDYPPDAIVQANNTCPHCGANQFVPAQDATGQPIGETKAFGRGKTTALSPFEYALPPNVTHFDDVPYIIRLRWREKSWFEANQPDLVPKITWEKSPQDRSLQIFKSLSVTNDISTGNNSWLGTGGSDTTEGVTEYEVWMKPTQEFPEGLVFRVVGDKDPLVLDLPDQGLPGPMPFKDIQGSPIFPFVHCQYEHVGGRLLGRSALAPLIQKQDQLNQLDSLIQLIIQRMANPVWVIPENAGIDQFVGEPGWIMKWNPLAGGGVTAKPERLDGSEVPASLYQLRAQIIQDIEDLSGAFDIIKGQKPSGVEAFSALQLLVERSQSRFTSVFQGRGEMYRKWFSIAIELERAFGPQQRTWAVVGPNKGYTFRHFENAQLQGQVSFVVEDGSTMPKTSLGKRAAIEQANQLRLLDPTDPDQRYALLSNFGLSDLSPSLNFHVQAALQMQDAFERWTEAPQGNPPLVIKPWFDLNVHWTERVKWLNTDKMREILATKPELEPFIIAHLQEMQMMMAPPVQIDPKTGQPIQSGAGGAQAMGNSNQESGAIDTLPQGNTQTPNGQVGPI